MRIDLDHKRLNVAFFITLFATLFFPVLLPSAHLIYFAPFLVMTYYQRPFLSCLWLALFCGTVVDLLSSYQHFGLYALNYCMCSTLLYQQRKNFFADRISTLPLMTFFFSALSTFFMMCLYNVYEGPLVISPSWFFTDMIMLPLFDALFSFTIFTLPPLLMGYKPMKGEDYFRSAQ